MDLLLQCDILVKSRKKILERLNMEAIRTSMTTLRFFERFEMGQPQRGAVGFSGYPQPRNIHKIPTPT